MKARAEYRVQGSSPEARMCLSFWELSKEMDMARVAGIKIEKIWR